MAFRRVEPVPRRLVREGSRLVVHAGEDRVLRMVVRTPDGAVRPLPGASGYFAILDRLDGSTAYSQGVRVTDYRGGIVQVDIRAVDTVRWLPGQYDYQIVMQDASGDVSVVLEGVVEIRRLGRIG